MARSSSLLNARIIDRLKKPLVVGALVCFSSVTGLAANGLGASFRGMKFGVPLRDQAPECVRDSNGIAGYEAEPKATCWTGSSGTNVVIGLRIIDSLTHTTFSIYTSATLDGDGNLVGITEKFSPGGFHEVDTLFRTKYGKPAATLDRPCQTGIGVQLTCHTRVWNWKGIHIEIVSPWDTADEALVLIMTRERFAVEKGNQLHKERQSLKDL